MSVAGSGSGSARSGVPLESDWASRDSASEDSGSRPTEKMRRSESPAAVRMRSPWRPMGQSGAISSVAERVELGSARLRPRESVGGEVGEMAVQRILSVETTRMERGSMSC